MFGHSSDEDDTTQNEVVQPNDQPVQDQPTSAPVADDNQSDDQSVPVVEEAAPQEPTSDPMPQLEKPIETEEEPVPDLSADSPVESEETPTPEEKPVVEPDTESTTTIGVSSDALLEIKRSALHELSPLLDELSQPPEEKFRTTMMMIQAFDDQKLVQTAYEAAKQIKDRKERAEALLDIVNEINYFTQDKKSD